MSIAGYLLILCVTISFIARYSTEYTSTSIFEFASIATFLLTVFGLSLPMVFAVSGKYRMTPYIYIASAMLIIAVFTLPGYSSTWLPLFWSAVFVFAIQQGKTSLVPSTH